MHGTSFYPLNRLQKGKKLAQKVSIKLIEKVSMKLVEMELIELY